eukprot:4478972-Pleurochrysis_carterae.AAC.4
MLPKPFSAQQLPSQTPRLSSAEVLRSFLLCVRARSASAAAPPRGGAGAMRLAASAVVAVACRRGTRRRLDALARLRPA